MGGGLLCLLCGSNHNSLNHFCFQSGVAYKIGDLEFKRKFNKLCELPFDENRFQNCKSLFETEEEMIEYVNNFYNDLFEKLNIE
jgi:hypothetical protein